MSPAPGSQGPDRAPSRSPADELVALLAVELAAAEIRGALNCRLEPTARAALRRALGHLAEALDRLRGVP